LRKKRRLPISIDDFKRIIEENYAYVDKTLFIQELWENGADVSIIPRPRRFGKTVNMSMLRYFFEKSAKDNSPLFTNLNIWKIPEYRALQGTFPVIFLTLKGAKDAADWNGAYERLKFIIAEEYRRHSFLLDSDCLQPDEKQTFQSIINRSASEITYSFSLKFLSHCLRSYHQKNVIILIDEYDSPIINAYLRNFYDPMLLFMRAWLGEGLKGNSNLARGVITGILRVAKEDLFSSLNNPKTYTILDKAFADKFGFLEQELSILLEEYGLSTQLESMRKWYNGYRIGSQTVYNPWSIMNCIDSDGALRAYWVNTGGTGILNRILLKGSEYHKNEIEVLLSEDELIKPIREGSTLRSLDKDGESIWNILLFSGYLTLANSPTYNETIANCSLKIPNYEVHCLYKEIIKDWFFTTIKEEGTHYLLKSLLTGDIDTFATLLNKFIIETISYYDIPENEPEKIYHALVLGMLIFLRETHEVKSNRESGYGRYDVLIIPKNKNDLGIVLEFKTFNLETAIQGDKVMQDFESGSFAMGVDHSQKVKATPIANDYGSKDCVNLSPSIAVFRFNPKQNKDLEEGALSALKQIEDKQYSQELHQRGIANVLGIGLAFQGKQVVINHRTLN